MSMEDFIFGDGSGPKLPEIYTQVPAFYDGKKFMFDNGSDYVPIDRASMKAFCEESGILKQDVNGAICMIQSKNYVKFAGPIAGRKRGIHEALGGGLVLATQDPKVIKSNDGACPTIMGFIRDLFECPIHGADQVETFLGWMHVARKAMLEGKRRPGQALVLAGPIQCGKTQLVSRVIIEAMGGRSCSPYRYLTGATGFNGDILGSEVLVIDDEAGNPHLAARRRFADGIKVSLFPKQVRIEAKFKEGFDFDPLWRLVIACNDEPEALLALPPLFGDLDDKIIILKCVKALETDDDAFDAWTEAIKRELPAFLHLIENFKIQPENADGRCGVKAFMHPDVVASIDELSPEHQMLGMIHTLETLGNIVLPWEGTAAALRSLLLGCHTTSRDAEKLLPVVSVAGKYLSRLGGKGIRPTPGKAAYTKWRIPSFSA